MSTDSTFCGVPEGERKETFSVQTKERSGVCLPPLVQWFPHGRSGLFNHSFLQQTSAKKKNSGIYFTSDFLCFFVLLLEVNVLLTLDLWILSGLVLIHFYFFFGHIYTAASWTSRHFRGQRLCPATDMHPPPRPPNRSDGSTAVTASEESGGGSGGGGGGGDPPLVGAAGASAQTSRSNDRGEWSFGRPGSSGGGEPDSPPRCRLNAISLPDGLGVFQKRSIFSFPRRSSSGYFSFDGDSLPSSPLSPRPATADRATQTPTPSGQVMKHALQRMAEARGGGPGTQRLHESSSSPSSTRRRNAAGDMQAEAVGQELRRIGDDFNGVLLSRLGDI
ncbi:uncharacterized protein LOC120796321 isoform X2 [Xiphias gladius]|uniref:uncharacterized protein LOC120796321 isoform X2 n=1 Tax=Xiphias gladius TaxID=8245 RepID=UPI001A99A21C|nr:uncharacterized protein LOC120796321 isoform X2 [Xiphias gladius]